MFPPSYNDYPYDIYNARNWLEFGWIRARPAFVNKSLKQKSYETKICKKLS
jgi:hypothetical protein